MKHLFENWNSYLQEEESDEMILYHISSSPDITELDPEIAAKNLKNYTKAEYRAWDRPRVFYFTQMSQEDAGVGKIQGEHAYEVKIKSSELYPIYEDPLKLSFPDSKKEYLEIREKETKKPKYYPVNTFEMVATMASRKHGMKGFIYPQDKDPDTTIVALWEKVPATKLADDFYGDQE